MKQRILLKTAGMVAAAGAAALLAFLPATGAHGGNVVGGGYAGSEKCKECHEVRYKAWEQNSRKSDSWETISRMKGGLTPEEFEGCLRCHTTGYKEETGFESVEKTPGLKNVGCEACHGPGTLHSEKMEKEFIVKTPTIEHCAKCHEQEDEDGVARVTSFRYKKVIYAGAH